MALLLYIGFNWLKTVKPLKDSLLLTTISSRVPGAYLIYLGGMKGWANHGAFKWFDPRTPGTLENNNH